jgi:hypothetical protein
MMKIAPKQKEGYWKVCDWQEAHDKAKWPTMIQIFEDRINHRYLDAVEILRKTDTDNSAPRFGFAIMALDSLLIETLAQFYKGKRRSPGGGKNGPFYSRFLYEGSFVFSKHFNKPSAYLFWDTIRCGILHQGETKASSKIKKTGCKPFENIGDGLIIYRDKFHDKLMLKEFSEYVTCLKTGANSDYRTLFIQKMNYICGETEIDE